jgi:hypothetical protein
MFGLTDSRIGCTNIVPPMQQKKKEFVDNKKKDVFFVLSEHYSIFLQSKRNMLIYLSKKKETD